MIHAAVFVLVGKLRPSELGLVAHRRRPGRLVLARMPVTAFAYRLAMLLPACSVGGALMLLGVVADSGGILAFGAVFAAVSLPDLAALLTIRGVAHDRFVRDDPRGVGARPLPPLGTAVVNPVLRRILPRLRAALDDRGAAHVRIVERAEWQPTPEERARILADGEPNLDEWIEFHPPHADWRRYELAGAEGEKWLQLARDDDGFDTPTVSRENRRWRMDTYYAGGGRVASTPWQGSETEFIAHVADYVANHFRSRVYRLRVHLSDDGGHTRYRERTE